VTKSPAGGANNPNRDPETGRLLPKDTTLNVDNVNVEAERPTGNSAAAGLRRLQKEASAEDHNGSGVLLTREEKNAETPISAAPKTPETGSVSFVSSSSAQIQDFFAADIAGAWDDEDWQVAFEERAAIFEYDGGWSREAAEQFARQWINEQRSLTRSNS